MPKNHHPDSDSEKSKNDSGSGSDAEEEEYVVEKVVDKRIKGGKVTNSSLVDSWILIFII